MVNLRIYKYPAKKIYVEVKFDYSTELWRYVKTRGFKAKFKTWHWKMYDLNEPEFKALYKQDMKTLLDSSKYKRIEYFKFMKKISNVEKILESLGVEL